MIFDKLKTAFNRPKVTIYADGHAERFTCSVCGRTYISRGVHDPGNLCRDCEAEHKAKLIGGPFNGQYAK